jgi:hypothetical protein
MHLYFPQHFMKFNLFQKKSYQKNNKNDHYILYHNELHNIMKHIIQHYISNYIFKYLYLVQLLYMNKEEF